MKNFDTCFRTRKLPVAFGGKYATMDLQKARAQKWVRIGRDKPQEGIIMFNRIGFTAKPSPEAQEANEYTAPVSTRTPRPCVAKIYFPQRHLTPAYYNDQFDLHPGDFVYVEGKLEGLLGQVLEVSYSFKIRLSDYKRVIAVADTTVHGRFYMAGSHALTFEPTALPYQKALSWLQAPNAEETVCGTDDGADEAFALCELETQLPSPTIARQGLEYFRDGRVVYLCVDRDRGYALVQGREVYEIEFCYRNGQISHLVCSCYCVGRCKHEIAAMLQLNELVKKIEKDYSRQLQQSHYFAAMDKDLLFRFAVDGKDAGGFTL